MPRTQAINNKIATVYPADVVLDVITHVTLPDLPPLYFEYYSLQYMYFPYLFSGSLYYPCLSTIVLLKDLVLKVD